MEVIKRHKGLAVVCILTLILLIIIFIIFARMLFGNKDSVYGDRLSGLVKIDTSIKDEIIDDYSEKKEVEDISIRVQGKIIYTTINYKEGTKLATAKDLASKVVGYYDEDTINYYDFGFFLVENMTGAEKSGFVVAGTKHPDNKDIKWTK
ncbi:MAG: hypothetical protein IJO57_05260 [Bacilli bacterium]|nr:hypothetical protein [Bacilli bacterium]